MIMNMDNNDNNDDDYDNELVPINREHWHSSFTTISNLPYTIYYILYSISNYKTIFISCNL